MDEKKALKILKQAINYKEDGGCREGNWMLGTDDVEAIKIAITSLKEELNKQFGILSKKQSYQNYDNIVFKKREDAEKVLDQLFNLIDDYGQVTVSDLYYLVGMTPNFTDYKYGWTDLRKASIGRVRNGYSINLPIATRLD